MANEFKVKNGLIIDQGGAIITGSVTATSGFTGSLQGTASFALAVAGGGGGGSTFPFTGSAQITGSLGVTGSINDLLIGKGNGANGATNISIGATTAFSSSINVNATNNIAIGSSSLQNLNSGSNNIALGQSALLSNTSGSRNIAIGLNALRGNTTSNNNVAIGYKVLQTGSSNNNVAIGNKAGMRTTGSFGNFFIGNYAGYGTGSLQNNKGGNIFEGNIDRKIRWI